jgi:predicted ribosome quality control (RQC) complex YloA/Tae2 family protein
MNKMKMDLAVYKEVVNELNSTILSSFISQITLVSSNDILLSFSHYRKEKLLISLNHESPFISLINTSASFSTIMNHTSEILRKEFSEAKIQNISILNNDRILDIEVSKTNDYFELERKHLIIEFIPHRPNLILLNEEYKIEFATHYSSLDSAHIILKGLKYEAPISNLNNFESLITLEEFKTKANEYLSNAKKQRRKDKFLKLITNIDSKIKSLKNKIKKLNKEIDLANEKLIYKDYGDYALSCIYDEEALKEYIKEEIIKDYQEDLTLKDNANRYFKIYKKAKSTLEHVRKEIEIASEQIEYFSHIKTQIDLGDDDDILEIQESLFPSKNTKNNRKIKTYSYHYVIVNNTKIAFGKTDKQNDILTFSKTHPTHYFFHIKDYSGAHVVVMSDKLSDEIILTSTEICLILSKKTSGEVLYTKIKDTRKGEKLGQVNLKSFKSIYLNKIRKSTIELINNSSKV